MADIANFYVDQGTDFSAALNLFFANNSDPLNVDDFIFSCGVKKVYSESILFYPSIYIIENDGIINNIEIKILSSQTKDLKPGKYVYDIIMTEVGSGWKTKVLEGLLYILPSIAKE